jgi:hypothetical protein
VEQVPTRDLLHKFGGIQVGPVYRGLSHLRPRKSAP